MRRRWKKARTVGLAGLVGLAVLSGAGLYLAHERAGRERSTVRVVRSVSPAGPRRRNAAPPPATPPPPSASPSPAATPERPLPAAPRSLRGTDVDGALRVDARGDLRLDPEVISLFDYFLTATGEEPAEVIRARIVAAIRERVDGRAAEQAIALLDRYLEYRAGAPGPPVPEDADPAERLAALEQRRRDRFGEPAASELFGAGEHEAAVAIEQGRIAADEALPAGEREARIAELEATLPEATRAAREEARRPLREQAEERALRAAGATDEEIHDHRVATVGIEAAGRLEALDRQRAEWTRRVDRFLGERERLEAAGLDPAERQAAEEALLGRDFTPEERLRVRANLASQGG